MKHLKYLNYIVRHKWFVALACLSRGLWWRAVVHDFSKFRPDEWFPYVEYFYGEKYTNEQRHQCFNVTGCLLPTEASVNEAFDKAWLLHQNRNSHHWQFWVLKNDDGSTVPLEMPKRDMLEMLSDWDGAGRAITGRYDTANWYLKNREKMALHPKTRTEVEQNLGIESLTASAQVV